jgi:uncharacterized protein YcfJ
MAEIDYSKIPTSDLEALNAKDYSRVRTETLEYLSGKRADPFDDLKKQTWVDDLKSNLLSGYRNIVRPTIQTGGMIAGAGVGGTAGTFGAGPVGTTVGTVAGAMGGNMIVSNALDVFEQAVGLQKPKTFKEAAQSNVDYAKEGAYGEMGGQAVNKIVSKGASFIGREAQKSAEQLRTMRAAKELNIDLTPAEETGSKMMSMFEKALAFLPGSSNTINKEIMGQLNDLTTKRENFINLVNNGKGTPESVEMVGNKIKNIIDKYVVGKQGVKDAKIIAQVNTTLQKLGSKDTYESLQLGFKDAIEQRSQVANALKREKYGEIGQYIPEGDYETPNLAITAQKVLEKESNALEPNSQLINISKRILKTEQNPEVANIIESIKDYPPKVQQQIMADNGITPEMINSQKPRNWQTLQDFRVELNDLISKNNQAMKQGSGLAGQSTREGSIFGEMKKALDKDLEGIAKDSGSEAYDRLMATNKWFSEEYAPVWKNKEIKNLVYKSPQAIIDTVFTGKTSTKDVDRLVQAVGQDKYIDLQKGFINKIFDKASQSGEPTKIWENVYKELSKYGNEPLAAMFSKNPQDLKYLMTSLSRGMAGARQPTANRFLVDIIKQQRPETISNMIFTKNNSANINTVKRILPKDIYDEARAYFLSDKLLKISEYGLYRPQISARAMSMVDEPTMRAIFSPEERSFMQKMFEVSKGMERVEKLASNPSGTAQAVITFESGRAVLQGAGQVVTGSPGGGLAKILSYTLLPKAIAKLYLSPMGRKLLVEGIKTPKSSPQSAKIMSQLIGIIGKENLQQDQGGSQ